MKIVVFNNTQSEQIHVQPKGSGNQAKRWEITINNYTQEDIDWILRLEGNVICYKEVGESGIALWQHSHMTFVSSIGARI